MWGINDSSITFPAKAPFLTTACYSLPSRVASMRIPLLRASPTFVTVPLEIPRERQGSPQDTIRSPIC
jgi:hypothetical protein